MGKTQLIAISGKVGSGKDTVASIIQYLTSKLYQEDKLSYQDFLNRLGKNNGNHLHKWQNKKFADKLKDIVCILIGCTRKQLEDRSIKSLSLQELADKGIISKEFVDLLDVDINGIMKNKITKKSTIRDVMQILGTNLLREGFNNNIHVAATLGSIKENEKIIITDLRFPNELKAVKDRGGITIRVNRLIGKRVYIISNEQPFENWYGTVESYNYNGFYNVINNVDDVILVHKNQIILQDEHSSETALDDYKFNYYIDNNGTIEELIENVKQILIKENILGYEDTNK